MNHDTIEASIVSSVYLNYSIQDAIQCVAEAGYQGIDIWGGRPHVYRHDHSLQELKALKGELSDLHLAVPSFMPAFFRYPYSLSSPNAIIRQDSVDYTCRCLDNALVLGAQVLLIIPGKTLFRQTLEDARQRMIDSIHQICEYAAQFEIRLGLEAANRMVTDLVNTSSDAMSVLNSVGYDKLGVVLDTGHLNLTQESPEEAVRTLGRRLLQFHVNDNDGHHQQNLIPGNGTFDFHRLIKTLHANNFHGYISVELGWDYTSDPVSAAVEAAKRLQDLLSRNRVQSQVGIG